MNPLSGNFKPAPESIASTPPDARTFWGLIAFATLLGLSLCIGVICDIAFGPTRLDLLTQFFGALLLVTSVLALKKRLRER